MFTKEQIAKNNATTQATRKKRQKLFLEAYALSGVVTTSARAAGLKTSSAHQKWKKNDAKYAAAFAEAQQICDDELVTEIRRRALDLNKKDTTALIVMLKMRGLFIEKREWGGAPQQVVHHVLTKEDQVIATRIASKRLVRN